MADPTLAFAQAEDIGQIEQRVSLRGKIAVRGGSRVHASVVRTDQGLFLVGAKSRDQGVCIDLLERSDFQYERGAFGDRIALGELVLGIPASARREVRAAIALARLGRAGRGGFDPVWVGRHVPEPTPIERAFLDAHLRPGEVLLAFRALDRDAPVESTLCPGTAGTGYLLVSDQRVERCVLSALGDFRGEPLDGIELRLDEGLGNADLLAGRLRFTVPRSDVELLREVLAAIALPATARIAELARLNFLHRDEGGALACSRALLAQAAKRGDPAAIATAFMVACELDEPLATAPELDPVVPALAEQGAPPEALAEAWTRFELSPEPAVLLIRELRRHGDRAEPWALELHEALHARLSRLRKDPKRLARADVELAEHLLETGQRQRAERVLEARVAELPSEELEDLLPKDDADLTAGAGGQVLRIRVFELLAEARGTPEQKDAGAIAELARLQPLVIPRVRALAEANAGRLSERAERVLRVLEPGGLEPGAQSDMPRLVEPNPLSGVLLESVLPHPVAREGSALVGKIQTLLAAVPAPDHRLLLEYVEPITVARHPAAARALSQAARVLGLESVQGFVSRGKKGIGFRSYDNPTPFVLIGGRHLDDDAEYGMTEEELSFAIATEVAHLKYGHARVTSSEVWAGLFERSKEGLDLLLGVLPLFRGYRVAERAYQILQKVPTSTIKRVVGGAEKVRRRMQSRPQFPDEPPRSDDVLSTVHEDLVATARVMQLTADRAGLLLSGSLRAALRAMLLERKDHREELGIAARDGIEAVLRQRGEDGVLTHQALAVRVAALISFYLSDDYATLRSHLL